MIDQSHPRIPGGLDMQTFTRLVVDAVKRRISEEEHTPPPKGKRGFAQKTKGQRLKIIAKRY